MLYSKYTIAANKYKYLPFKQMIWKKLHENWEKLLKKILCLFSDFHSVQN